MDTELATYTITCPYIFYGLTPKVKHLAYQYGQKTTGLKIESISK